MTLRTALKKLPQNTPAHDAPLIYSFRSLHSTDEKQIRTSKDIAKKLKALIIQLKK